MISVLRAYCELIRACVRTSRLGMAELRPSVPSPKFETDPASAATEQLEIQTAQRALGLAEHGFPLPVTCLQRSLALQRMLSRRGIATTLRVGVCIEQAELEAHAWLEYRGQLLNTSAENRSRFAPLHVLRKD